MNTIPSYFQKPRARKPPMQSLIPVSGSVFTYKEISARTGKTPQQLSQIVARLRKRKQGITWAALGAPTQVTGDTP